MSIKKNQQLFLQDTDEQNQFNGEFNDNFRRILRCKRLQLGLSYSSLGHFLGINWATVRKWEQGPTKCCASYFIRKLNNLFNGVYDQSFVSCQNYPSKNLYRNVPDAVSICSEKVTNTYRVCEQRPELRKELLNSIITITNKTIEDIVKNN